MKRVLLSLFTAAVAAFSFSQSVVELKPIKHADLDSLVRAQMPLMTDGQKARAMQLVVGKNYNVHDSYDLRDDYDLWPSDAQLQVGPVHGLVEGKKKYPDCWRSFVEEKKPDGTAKYTAAQADAAFQKLSLADAAAMDALWRKSPYVPIPGARGLLLSNNNITWPLGTYYCTVKQDIAYGIYSGSGSFNGDLASGLGGTELVIWHDQWQGDPLNRVLMGAFHAGSDNFFAYSEGQQVHNLRFNGGAGNLKDPNRNITGLWAWDTGEGSNYSNLFIHHCDIGLDVTRGTPFTGSGTISLFENTQAGIALTGGAGATINFQTVSGDDNPRMFWVRPGWGRPSGTSVWVSTTKSEWAITGGRYKRPMMLLDGEGWIRAQFGTVSYAANAYAGDLINIKADLNTSHVGIQDLRVFGAHVIDGILRDRVNGEYWPYDVGWTSGIIKFDWYSQGGGTLKSEPVQVTPLPCTTTWDRLGYLSPDPQTGQAIGVFNRMTGTPSWSDTQGNGAAGTAPPPSPCSAWTYGPWSDCVNGTRTRTATAAPSGCTGTPTVAKEATTEACSVTIGNVQTVLAGNSSTKVGCTVPLVKRIVFTKLRASSGADLAGFTGYINDKVYLGANGCYADIPSQTKLATVTTINTNITNNASTTTLTVEFPTPVALKYAIGSDLKTAPFTFTKVELFP